MGWYYAIAAASCIISLCAMRLLKNKRELVLKVMSGVLVGLFFFRYLGGEFVITDTIGLNRYSPFGATGAAKTALSLIVLWLTFAIEIVVFSYPYYKDKIKSLSVIMHYFAPVAAIAAAATIPWICTAMDGTKASSLFWRDVLYAVEVGVLFAYVASEVVFGITEGKIKTDRRQFAVASGVFGLMLLSALPSYAIQVLFGYGSPTILIKEFSIYHRIVLYAAILLPFAVHFALRKQDYDHRRYALTFWSVAALISYCYKVTVLSIADLSSWPLHLCNTAMFIVPVCLMFKWDKLFYFTLFINVMGAFLAMVMPNTGDTANYLSVGVINFWVNHYCAFFMPVLMLSLRIFSRPKLKQFIYSLVAFALYYVLILFVNAWCSNYNPDVDFFFTNSDFIAEKLGQWAEDLRNTVWSFNIGKNKMVFYPVYQMLFFLVYVVISLAMWFLYEQAFEIADLYTEIGVRNKKIKADRLALEVKLAGRSSMEPMNPEGSNKLILKNFSKRYSTSDVYAVKDACLMIDGGQIFGFLGPNGAGKSTIIKSIVGIQTITEGSIEVCGYDVEKQPVGAKKQIGFVPDHYALYENLTGREYINYIADLYDVSEEERSKRIEEYVTRFYLSQAFDNPMKTYSHGMKQKIAIMAALVHEPKVWILDEPLTGLDPESIWQVKECMKAHAENGNIVFFSSHIIDVVERICDRIAIIKKGTIMCNMSLKEIEQSGEPLEDFYMRTIGEIKHD